MSMAHRPWPTPDRTWIMRMQWCDLAFLHWKVSASAIQATLPRGLALDTFEGEAYLGVVPFRMAGVAPRGIPPAPGLSRFPELNLRTYVIAEGKPGVWFYSLDASQWLAVRMARWAFHLPYFDAQMKVRIEDGWTFYESTRTHRGAPPGAFRGRYRPVGPEQLAKPGTLEHWLTERYCLYAESRGRIFRGDVHHAPWPLQPAECEIEHNTIGLGQGFDLSDSPVSQLYAKRLDVVAWFLSRSGP